MNHLLLDNSQEYLSEEYQNVKNRYSGFGIQLYEFLQENEPDIFCKLKFYRAIKLLEKTSWGTAETENSYAIYDDGVFTFGIQLDPLSEVICLHNHKTQIELGNWDQLDYCSKALEFIKKELLTKS